MTPYGIGVYLGYPKSGTELTNTRTIMTKYIIAPELKQSINNAIAEVSAKGIAGGFYKFKAKECSCCYGLKGENIKYEINENIPGNWGIAHIITGRWSADGMAKGYHKVSGSFSNEEGKIIFNALRRNLKGSGWNVTWPGKTNASCIMIEKANA